MVVPESLLQSYEHCREVSAEVEKFTTSLIHCTTLVTCQLAKLTAYLMIIFLDILGGDWSANREATQDHVSVWVRYWSKAVICFYAGRIP